MICVATLITALFFLLHFHGYCAAHVVSVP